MRNNSFQPEDHDDITSAIPSHGHSARKNGFDSEKFTDNNSIVARTDGDRTENGPRSARNSRLNRPEGTDFQAHSPLIDLNRTKLESGDENWIPLDSIEAKDDVLHEVICVSFFDIIFLLTSISEVIELILSLPVQTGQ